MLLTQLSCDMDVIVMFLCRMPRLTRVLSMTLSWWAAPPVSPRCRACCQTSSMVGSCPRASTLTRLLHLELQCRSVLLLKACFISLVLQLSSFLLDSKLLHEKCAACYQA